MPFVPVFILDELSGRTKMFAQSRLSIKTANILFAFQAIQKPAAHFTNRCFGREEYQTGSKCTSHRRPGYIDHVMLTSSCSQGGSKCTNHRLPGDFIVNS